MLLIVVPHGFELGTLAGVLTFLVFFFVCLFLCAQLSFFFFLTVGGPPHPYCGCFAERIYSWERRNFHCVALGRHQVRLKLPS